MTSLAPIVIGDSDSDSDSDVEFLPAKPVQIEPLGSLKRRAPVCAAPPKRPRRQTPRTRWHCVKDAPGAAPSCVEDAKSDRLRAAYDVAGPYTSEAMCRLDCHDYSCDQSGSNPECMLRRDGDPGESVLGFERCMQTCTFEAPHKRHGSEFVLDHPSEDDPDFERFVDLLTRDRQQRRNPRDAWEGPVNELLRYGTPSGQRFAQRMQRDLGTRPDYGLPADGYLPPVLMHHLPPDRFWIKAAPAARMPGKAQERKLERLALRQAVAAYGPPALEEHLRNRIALPPPDPPVFLGPEGRPPHFSPLDVPEYRAVRRAGGEASYALWQGALEKWLAAQYPDVHLEYEMYKWAGGAADTLETFLRLNYPELVM